MQNYILLLQTLVSNVLRYARFIPKFALFSCQHLTTDSDQVEVSADTPAKDFWSVIVYSTKTKGFIVGKATLGLSSRNTETMQNNADGSYDVYFGPEAPEGKESNWIPSGEDFYLLFRLYGPTSKDFYKTWMLGDVEKIK